MKNKTVCGSNDLNSRKEDNRRNTASGSKGLCGSKTKKKNKENGRTNENTPPSCYKKYMRSMHSSVRIEEMICELEGERWDAVLLNETWRLPSQKFGRLITIHIHGCRKIRQKHGVGSVLNKKCRQKSSILKTSANGPSQQRIWSTINVSS